MWGFRKQGGDHGLERRLRSARPEAPDHLVNAVSTRVAGRERPRVGSRLAFAAAFSTLLLGSFAAFGGVGYTTAGASHAYKTAKNLTAAKPVRVQSAADDQYKPTPKENEGVASASASQTSQSQTAGAAVAREQGQTLPFTGISLLATVIVALALMALGFALRRRERQSA